MAAESEVIRQFLECEKRWISALADLRSFHCSQMGKSITPIQWIAGTELARFSWLGFYWAEELLWFGYGLRDDAWTPLIEADNRSKYSAVIEDVRMALLGTWEVVESKGGLYRRFWAPASVVGSTQRELDWFKTRSRELHEFLVHPYCE